MSTLTQPTEAMVETVARGEFARITEGARGVVLREAGYEHTYPAWDDAALSEKDRDAYRDRARIWLRIALPLVTEAMVVERLRAIAEEAK